MPSIDRVIESTSKISSELSRTSAKVDPAKKIPSVIVSKQVNPLNQFRSFNYIFTLACVKSGSLKDPDSLRKSADYYVIAKSSGKGSESIKLDGSFNTSAITPKINANNPSSRNFAQDYMDVFNAKSPGRFDFFINNVEIETLMTASQQANTSLATKIKFEIYEPYSLNGFMEALQTAALAAGHVNYVSAPFLLKMEFIGYPDTDNGASETIKKLGSEGTRYFVFSFTNLTVEATEEGTRYQCEAVPHNEKAFGKPNELTANIKITGKTVGEILSDFSKQINLSKEEESKKIRGKDVPVKCDKYQIVLPSWSGSKMDLSVPNAISSAEVTTLSRTNNNYKFADPGKDNQTTISYIPGKTEVQFSDTVNIHDCISAIIRDSEYTKNLIKQIESGSNTVMVNGMVDYFLISIESVPQGVWDEVTKRELYTYTYVISPYKIHYTRIPLYENKTVNADQLKLLARREYNYLYTGKNVDVRKFSLRFDNLYYQAIPLGLGNNSVLFSSANGQEAQETANLVISGQTAADSAKKKNYADAPIYVDTRSGTANPQKGSGSKRDMSDPYTAMVVNMHQAILDNLSMISAEITILGDPFYLVTGGMGNYKPAIITYGETVDNEAAYQQGDVFIVVNFRNPIDINSETGLLEFSSTLVPFSGVFRVISVNSTFRDGIFEQKLQLLRVPGQPIDTNQQVDKNISIVESKENPLSYSLADFTSFETEFSLPESLPSLSGMDNILSGKLPSLSLDTSVLSKYGSIASQASSIASNIKSSITGVSSLANSVASKVSGIGSNITSSIGGASSVLNDATNIVNRARTLTPALSEINKLAYGNILEDATSSMNQVADPKSITNIFDNINTKIIPSNLASISTNISQISTNVTNITNKVTPSYVMNSSLSKINTNLVSSVANSALSLSNQVAVGSAEIINRVSNQQNLISSSVGVKFGDKTNISPLLSAVINNGKTEES